MEIGLHRRITKSRDGLRQEQSDALQRNSQANFDGQNDPVGGLFQDGNGVAEHGWLVDHRGRVYLHPVQGQLLLILGQELRVARRVWQEDESHYHHVNRQAALKSEERVPICQRVPMGLESAESQQPTQGVGGRLRVGDQAHHACKIVFDNR